LNAAEVGVFQGGSSYFICDLLRRVRGESCSFHAVDTFEGHAAADLAGEEGIHEPGKFSGTRFEDVQRLLSEFGFARVLKGRIQDRGEELDGTFHFVHLDVDIHAPMAYALKRFLPRMAAGGIICVDDYKKRTCPGVQKAVEEALAEHGRSLVGIYTQTAQFLLVRIGPQPPSPA